MLRLLLPLPAMLDAACRHVVSARRRRHVAAVIDCSHVFAAAAMTIDTRCRYAMLMLLR